MNLADREYELSQRLKSLYRETAEVNRELNLIRSQMHVFCPFHNIRMFHDYEWHCEVCEPDYWQGMS